MWFFNNKKKKIKGYIGLYGLEYWWLNTLNQEDRKQILTTYLSLVGDSKSLTEEDIKEENYLGEMPSTVHFLSGLASWFHRNEHRHIAHKIFDKLLPLVNDHTKILDKHFMYQHMIQIYYKDRNNPEYYDKSIWACNEQIKLSKLSINAFKEESRTEDFSLPSHVGYKQFAIILEKNKEYEKVIKLCKQAKEEGWSGDWDKRIERCTKKKEKMPK